ncbi:Homocysteine S-methyltransferase [Meira miltonrushii]|uniref:Homocysteine S-methyltransferase n=1 Tax=Meira miltonrushii TaxID=1280837 RepID=A0A316VF77_9BASI|nr:Homocysteine S-methyltransferase [Meira miltonrushii]PWN36287.1 Homocysteine S-methyltransferase [Meira miltonrushii]
MFIYHSNAFRLSQAGAQIISTSTYQASPLSFARAGIDKGTARALLLRSVDLTGQARKIYLEKHPDAIEKPLISLSLGPYGAAQSDGSEYTGIYYDPGNSKDDPFKPAALEDMIKFHYDRLEIIAAEPSIWSQVDLLAFETIPRLDEAEAIKQALDRLYSNDIQCQQKPAYISFVFPDGKRLPYPKQEGDEGEQKHFDEIARCVDTFEGIGVNCTKPYFLPEVVKKLTRAVEK